HQTRSDSECSRSVHSKWVKTAGPHLPSTTGSQRETNSDNQRINSGLRLLFQSSIGNRQSAISHSRLRPQRPDFAPATGSGSLPPMLEPVKVEIHHRCRIQREQLA